MILINWYFVILLVAFVENARNSNSEMTCTHRFFLTLQKHCWLCKVCLQPSLNTLRFLTVNFKFVKTVELTAWTGWGWHHIQQSWMLAQALPLSQALSPFSYYLQYNYSSVPCLFLLYLHFHSLFFYFLASFSIISSSYFPFSLLSFMSSIPGIQSFILPVFLEKSVKPQRYVVEETSYYVTSFYVCQEAGFLGCRRISCAACPCLFNLNLPGRALLTGAI